MTPKTNNKDLYIRTQARKNIRSIMVFHDSLGDRRN